MREGMLSELKALLLCVAIGFAIGVAAARWEGPDGERPGGDDEFTWPTAEMEGRGKWGGLVSGVIIALFSGVGVTLSLYNNISGGLVGVAISASLLPPAVNSGICLAEMLLGELITGHATDRVAFGEIAAVSFLLTLANILSIIAAGLCTLQFKSADDQHVTNELIGFARATERAARRPERGGEEIQGLQKFAKKVADEVEAAKASTAFWPWRSCPTTACCWRPASATAAEQAAAAGYETQQRSESTAQVLPPIGGASETKQPLPPLLPVPQQSSLPPSVCGSSGDSRSNGGSVGVGASPDQGHLGGPAAGPSRALAGIFGTLESLEALAKPPRPSTWSEVVDPEGEEKRLSKQVVLHMEEREAAAAAARRRAEEEARAARVAEAERARAVKAGASQNEARAAGTKAAQDLAQAEASISAADALIAADAAKKAAALAEAQENAAELAEEGDDEAADVSQEDVRIEEEAGSRAAEADVEDKGGESGDGISIQ